MHNYILRRDMKEQSTNKERARMRRLDGIRESFFRGVTQCKRINRTWRSEDEGKEQRGCTRRRQNTQELHI